VSITIPKTKIICTIGPASETPEVIRELIASGMSVARLNFSHGTLGDHEKKIHIIRRLAKEMDKPVIIATQMLRSMVDAPRPTRAEASDVANAVLDGTDAVMLSEETATGNYPVQSVRYMVRIVAEAEKTYPHDLYLKMAPEKEISDSVTYAVCVLADHLEATAILAPTQSGRTAVHISRFRPKQPIIAFTPSLTTLRRLSLFRGIYPHLNMDPRDTDDMIEKVSKRAVETGALSEGDLAVITAGHPVWVAGTTNMIRVKRCC
jgi:pyruvate kinase